jgi:hypothetical protein
VFNIRGQKNGGAGWGIIVGPAKIKTVFKAKNKKIKEIENV